MYLCGIFENNSTYIPMIKEEQLHADNITQSTSKIKDYLQLVKPNLSFLVVFSSVIGYLLAPNVAFEWDKIILLFLGGAFVTSGANIVNQIYERHTDKLMKRTANRPLPTGRMTVTEAVILCVLFSIIGLAIMYFGFNPLAALLSLISSILYGFAYTPLKRISPVCNLVGAIPGALPPLIGWVSATGTIFEPTDIGGWGVFAVQFFWQFPHLWAIAWVGHEDYQKAGMHMLPSKEGKTTFTGLQSMFYSLTLIPIVVLIKQIGLIGSLGMWASIVLGVFYFLASFNFYLKNDKDSAKKLMFSSFIYLPVVLVVMLFDKM